MPLLSLLLLSSVSRTRVIVPRTDLEDDATSRASFWAVVDNRKEVPFATPNQALEALRVQVELVLLCIKPGGLAEKVAQATGLFCILTTFKNQPDDILLGLPYEEYLSSSVRVS